MFFMLGTIALEATQLTDFSETHSAHYAEHAVIRGKPRLQAMGNNLNELNVSVRLHHTMGGVESRYQALIDAKAKQSALALIWGRGQYKGNYVITELSASTLFTDGYGNALARELDVKLKEFVGELNHGLLGEAISVGGKSLLGSILPDGLMNTLSNAKTIVNRAVNLYNEGKRIVDDVKNTVAMIRQVANDPVALLATIPQALSSVDGALGNFGTLSSMREMLSGASTAFAEVGDFAIGVGDIYQSLTEVRGYLHQGNSGTAWQSWVIPIENQLSSISDVTERLAPKVAKITTWIVLRTDEDTSHEQNVS